MTFTSPKAPIAMPAIRFIQAMLRSVILPRNRFVPLVRMSHQVIDPQNIPAISSDVSHKGLRLPSPRVASTVRKERTVVGLARVRRNAEAKSALAAPLFLAA